MSYPLKFREHVIKIKKEENLTYRELAKRVKIGIATLMRWAKEKNPIQKRKKHSRKIDMESLAKDVEKYPDDYQRERAARFGVSKHGIYWALKKLGVTYKKNPFTIRRRSILPEKLLKQK